MDRSLVEELAAAYMHVSAQKAASSLVAKIWLELKEVAGGQQQALAALRSVTKDEAA